MGTCQSCQCMVTPDELQCSYEFGHIFVRVAKWRKELDQKVAGKSVPFFFNTETFESRWHRPYEAELAPKLRCVTHSAGDAPAGRDLGLASAKAAFELVLNSSPQAAAVERRIRTEAAARRAATRTLREAATEYLRLAVSFKTVGGAGAVARVPRPGTAVATVSSWLARAYRDGLAGDKSVRKRWDDGGAKSSRAAQAQAEERPHRALLDKLSAYEAAHEAGGGAAAAAAAHDSSPAPSAPSPPPPPPPSRDLCVSLSAAERCALRAEALRALDFLERRAEEGWRAEAAAAGRHHGFAAGTVTKVTEVAAQPYGSGARYVYEVTFDDLSAYHERSARGGDGKTHQGVQRQHIRILEPSPHELEQVRETAARLEQDAVVAAMPSAVERVVEGRAALEQTRLQHAARTSAARTDRLGGGAIAAAAISKATERLRAECEPLREKAAAKRGLLLLTWLSAALPAVNSEVQFLPEALKAASSDRRRWLSGGWKPEWHFTVTGVNEGQAGEGPTFDVMGPPRVAGGPRVKADYVRPAEIVTPWLRIQELLLALERLAPLWQRCHNQANDAGGANASSALQLTAAAAGAPPKKPSGIGSYAHYCAREQPFARTADQVQSDDRGALSRQCTDKRRWLLKALAEQTRRATLGEPLLSSDEVGEQKKRLLAACEPIAVSAASSELSKAIKDFRLIINRVSAQMADEANDQQFRSIREGGEGLTVGQQAQHRHEWCQNRQIWQQDLLVTLRKRCDDAARWLKERAGARSGGATAEQIAEQCTALRLACNQFKDEVVDEMALGFAPHPNHPGLDLGIEPRDTRTEYRNSIDELLEPSMAQGAMVVPPVSGGVAPPPPPPPSAKYMMPISSIVDLVKRCRAEVKDNEQQEAALFGKLSALPASGPARQRAAESARQRRCAVLEQCRVTIDWLMGCMRHLAEKNGKLLLELEASGVVQTAPMPPMPHVLSAADVAPVKLVLSEASEAFRADADAASEKLHAALDDLRDAQGQPDANALDDLHAAATESPEEARMALTRELLAGSAEKVEEEEAQDVAEMAGNEEKEAFDRAVQIRKQLHSSADVNRASRALSAYTLSGRIDADFEDEDEDESKTSANAGGGLAARVRRRSSSSSSIKALAAQGSEGAMVRSSPAESAAAEAAAAKKVSDAENHFFCDHDFGVPKVLLRSATRSAMDGEGDTAFAKGDKVLVESLGATDEHESREVSVKEATVHNNNFEQLVSVSRDKEASVSVSHTYPAVIVRCYPDGTYDVKYDHTDEKKSLVPNLHLGHSDHGHGHFKKPGRRQCRKGFSSLADLALHRQTEHCWAVGNRHWLEPLPIPPAEIFIKGQGRQRTEKWYLPPMPSGLFFDPINGSIWGHADKLSPTRLLRIKATAVVDGRLQLNDDICDLLVTPVDVEEHQEALTVTWHEEQGESMELEYRRAGGKSSAAWAKVWKDSGVVAAVSTGTDAGVLADGSGEDAMMGVATLSLAARKVLVQRRHIRRLKPATKYELRWVACLTSGGKSKKARTLVASTTPRLPRLRVNYAHAFTIFECKATNELASGGGSGSGGGSKANRDAREDTAEHAVEMMAAVVCCPGDQCSEAHVVEQKTRKPTYDRKPQLAALFYSDTGAAHEEHIALPGADSRVSAHNRAQRAQELVFTAMHHEVGGVFAPMPKNIGINKITGEVISLDGKGKAARNAEPEHIIAEMKRFTEATDDGAERKRRKEVADRCRGLPLTMAPTVMKVSTKVKVPAAKGLPRAPGSVGAAQGKATLRNAVKARGGFAALAKSAATNDFGVPQRIEAYVPMRVMAVDVLKQSDRLLVTWKELPTDAERRAHYRLLEWNQWRAKEEENEVNRAVEAVRAHDAAQAADGFLLETNWADIRAAKQRDAASHTQELRRVEEDSLRADAGLDTTLQYRRVGGDNRWHQGEPQPILLVGMPEPKPTGSDPKSLQKAIALQRAEAAAEAEAQSNPWGCTTPFKVLSSLAAGLVPSSMYEVRLVPARRQGFVGDERVMAALNDLDVGESTTDSLEQARALTTAPSQPIVVNTRTEAMALDREAFDMGGVEKTPKQKAAIADALRQRQIALSEGRRRGGNRDSHAREAARVAERDRQTSVHNAPSFPPLRVGDRVHALDQLRRWSPGHISRVVEAVDCCGRRRPAGDVVDVVFDSEIDVLERTKGCHRQPWHLHEGTDTLHEHSRRHDYEGGRSYHSPTPAFLQKTLSSIDAEGMCGSHVGASFDGALLMYENWILAHNCIDPATQSRFDLQDVTAEQLYVADDLRRERHKPPVPLLDAERRADVARIDSLLTEEWTRWKEGDARGDERAKRVCKPYEDEAYVLASQRPGRSGRRIAADKWHLPQRTAEAGSLTLPVLCAEVQTTGEYVVADKQALLDVGKTRNPDDKARVPPQVNAMLRTMMSETDLARWAARRRDEGRRNVLSDEHYAALEAKTIRGRGAGNPGGVLGWWAWEGKDEEEIDRDAMRDLIADETKRNFAGDQADGDDTIQELSLQSPDVRTPLTGTDVQVRWRNPDSMPPFVWCAATAKTVVVRCVGRPQMSLGAGVAARPCAERCHALLYQPDKWKPFRHMELHNMAQKNFRVTQVAPIQGVPRRGTEQCMPLVLRDSDRNRTLLHRGAGFCLERKFNLRVLSLADLKSTGVAIEDDHMQQILKESPALEEVRLISRLNRMCRRSLGFCLLAFLLTSHRCPCRYPRS